MDQEAKIDGQCPYDSSNIFSKLFFVWLIPLFKRGNSKELDYSDLFKPPVTDRPDCVSARLEKNWIKELNRTDKKEPSLCRAVIKCWLSDFLIISQLQTINECVLRLSQPIFIGFAVKYFEAPGVAMSDESAYLAIAGICISSGLYTFSRNQWYTFQQRQSTQIKTAISIMIYKKVVKLSKSSFEKTSIGQILNMLTNDLNRIDDCGYVAWYLVVAPVQAVIVMFLLWGYLGWAAVAGLATLFLFIPFQAAMGRLFSRFRSNTSRLTDKRVKLMSELISAMKLIKVYCWEKPFADLVDEVRKDEIKAIKFSSLLKSINIGLFFVSTRVMLFVALVSHVFMGGCLDPQTVFVTIALFNGIRIPLTNHFPNAIGFVAETLVSLKRIQKLLLLEEKPDNQVESGSEHGTIELNKYTGKWNKTLKEASLKDITLKVKKSELVVVIGPVGAGKTCLLNALLNEIERISGKCVLSGQTSYAPQEAWCFGATIRENILLGSEYHQEKYNKVVEVCGLQRDLTLFPNGDATFVGEKGYTLSGGQKARVTLARAVYSEADVYLLDDPLSAVDPQVANHIFDKCINGYLKEKTVILVTHQLQFLEKADKVVILNNGKILAAGTFTELMASGIDFLAFLSVTKPDDKDRLPSRRQSSNKRFSMEDETEEQCRQNEEKAAADRKGREEVRGTGSVKPEIYWKYFRSGGSIFFIGFAFIMSFISQGMFHYMDFWLSSWTENYVHVDQLAKAEENGTFVNTTIGYNASELNSLPSSDSNECMVSPDSQVHNIIMYAVLMVVLFVSTFARTISFFILCLSCCIKLHNTIFSRLLRAPLLFFENNPLGRILNRFTGDMGYIDQLIPATVNDLNICVLNTLGVVLVSAVVNPYMLLPAIVIVIVSLPFRKIYLRTGRDVKRLDALTRSPVYGHISTTFDGLTTIRAFGLETKFEKQFMLYMNDATACRFITILSQIAVGFALDFLSWIYICVICVVLVAFPTAISGGDAGVVLTSVLMMTGFFQYGIRQSAEFETQMVSVERVLEYGQLASEAEFTSTGNEKLLQEWPVKGALAFKNIFLRYAGAEKPVLNNITLSIKGAEKIGIVGRTGAGKSSLITVLFRLAEPEGSVIIDGIDTKTLGLHELRNKISIIPQDPVLFSGTIRRNIDPFNEYDDSTLWRVLKEANLDKVVTALTGHLEGVVTEGGSNLSVGQRQLLCLARALLRNNKILVLDEATANVDHETDDLIQKTIKTKFNECTVLTVAHRLNTIIDMDKVLVLDAGKVIEYDHPHQLITEHGQFYNMCMQTGSQMSHVLFSQAEAAYSRKCRRLTGSAGEMKPRFDSSQKLNRAYPELINESLDVFGKIVSPASPKAD